MLNTRLLSLVLALSAILLTRPSWADEPTAAILTLVVNTVFKGEATVLLEGKDVLVAPADLAAAGLEIPAGPIEIRSGVAYRSLAALSPRLSYAVDDRELVLRMTAPPDFFPSTVVNLGRVVPRNIVYHKEPSAFLNYSLQLADGTHFSTFEEAGLSFGEGVLLGSATVSPRGPVRGLTDVTIDDRDRLMRWVVGDAFVNAGPLGGGLFMGGLTLSRVWELDPYFTRTPTLGFTGAVSTPSTVDVYLNGVLVRREPISPGPFQLQNLQPPSGAGVVRYVIRDVFGGERSINSPYYAAPGVLARGLSEFGYTLGVARRNFGTESFDYGKVGFSGHHRYAFNDSVTAGFRLEAAQDLVSFGPTAAIAVPFGELDLGLGASFTPAGPGVAALAAYSYQSPRVGVSLFLQGMSARYATLGLAPDDGRDLVTVSSSTTVAVTRSVTIGSQQILSLNRDQGISERTSVSGSVELQKGLSLLMSAGRSVAPGRAAELDIFASLTWIVGRDIMASTGTTVNGLQKEVFAQANKPLPPGSGVGFQAGAMFGEQIRGNALLAARSPYGEYQASYLNLNGDPHTQIAVAGGVVAMPSAGVFLTRPVQDGFAIVDVPGVKGVRGMLSNQEIGRTNGDGKMVITNLLPYYGNRIGIVDVDLPLDYEIKAVETLAAPPYRGGAHVVFAAKQAHYTRGTVSVRRGARKEPPAYGELVVRVGAETISSPLGALGEFELEGLPPGPHRGEVTYGAGTCVVALTVEAVSVPVQTLGELECVMK